MKSLVSVVTFLALAYLGFGSFLYLKQRSILYYPTPSIAHSFEEQPFTNDGLVINVVVVNPGQEKAAIYFGGNGEPVALTASNFAPLTNTSFYFLEYRGYGNSEGEPSEQGIYADALQLFDTVSHKHADVSVIGRSLGSGVATYIAVHREVEKLVLITPFDSITSVAQSRFPIYPAQLIIKDTYDSVARAASLMSTTLVLVAAKDGVVPGPHTDALVAQMNPARTRVVQLPGTGHNTITAHLDYLSLIRDHIGAVADIQP